jgi:hypothetical protein
MKRRTASHLLALIVTTLALSSVAQAQETMTVEKFHEIASSPGDSVPLDPKLLAVGPIITNATITVDVKYADGRTFKETIPGALKTIKGKYIVTTVKSGLYEKPMDSITAYDEKAGCFKYWGLFGDSIAEGLMIYDTDKKIYSTYSSFASGWLEFGVGSYSHTNISSHTIIQSNNVLFCTRNVDIVPARPVAK